MKLSVVIPTHNKVELLERTLVALTHQDLDSADTWEVVVVDDGSSDGTADFLEKRCTLGDLPLVVVSPPANVGRARARNLGARSARGNWILFLDDDIVAPPGLLRGHLEILEKDPNFGTIGYAVTEPGLIDGPHFHYLDSRGVARLGPGPAPARFFVTQNAAVARRAFLAVDGFDEDFSSYGFEDMEVAFRLEEKAGVRFQALVAPVPVHVHHHTLYQYLAKKVECGRHSLPHLARLHPGRIREMSLQYVVDIPASGPLSLSERVLRWITGSAPGRGLPSLMAVWPSGSGQRPLLSALYFRLMNLTVLSCFRQGVLENYPDN